MSEINEETLRQYYHGKKLSMAQVGERLGLTKHQVRHRMEKYGIARRSDKEGKAIYGGPPAIQTDHHGYERFQVSIRGENKILLHHRLLAVAEYGYDAVENGDHIHHKNGIPWDNRVSNVEPLTHSEHIRRHRDVTPTYEKYACWALYEESDLTYDDVADILNLNPSNVGSFIKNVREGKYEIEVEA